MAQGSACREPNHRLGWRVTVRKANYSAFSGGKRTPSAYSQVRCLVCGATWRTKANYVERLADAP